MTTVPGGLFYPALWLGGTCRERHPGETLKLKTLQSIIDQAGLTVEEFQNLL